MSATPPLLPAGVPIAIVGIGCRFPGADSLDAFWDLLCRGGEAVTEPSPNRFDIDALYHPEPATPGKVSTRLGGFLDNIDRFDASFFGISPREAAFLDPQQRLLLEVAWEAVEDAGQVPWDGQREAQAGVFVGLWLNEYESRMFEATDDLDFYMTTGSGRYAASGRLSYALGLGGPSVTVDTACSSSLVALHLACQSLREGECDLALAAAANVILQPYITVAYSQSKMMAADGRCKFGDAAADGYVRSEGVAVLALKRLSDALADDDAIHAVIRGSAVNNDGRGDGYLATPSQAGQEDLLRKAYRAAGVEPQAVQYVEAHGTGTRAGDPVEIGAIGAVLGGGRNPSRPLKVGSVKTNIGHTEGTAGLAGVIKTALAIRHRQLPASLHQHAPNPAIPWEELGVEVQRERSGWPSDDRPLIAGVSAFGITGTNGHVVLEEAPERVRDETFAPDGKQVQVLTLSARSEGALRAVAQAYRDWIGHGGESPPSLVEVCRTAATRRTHHSHRLALVGSGYEAVDGALAAFVEGVPVEGTVAGRARGVPLPVAFVFPGQGSQWFGMGRQLYEQEPTFRAVIDRCQAAFAPHVEWSLLDELRAGPDASNLEAIDVVQPVLFAIQVALAAVWEGWGIRPAAVVGHSMGEVAAAYVAGALTLDEAARVVCWRSRLMKRVSGQGAMAVVELSLDEAEETLTGYEGSLSIAVNNGPRSVVIAGDPEALDEVLDALDRLDVFCRKVKVDVASHSPHMEPLAPELVGALAELAPRDTRVPIYSTVTAEAQAGTAFDAAYWGRNLRQPVRFAETLGRLATQGPHAYVEMSPHPLLLQAILSSVEHTAPDAAADSVALPSFRREEDERANMLASLGALYVRGVPVDWNALHPAGGPPVALPTYPWQRERYWYTDLVGTRPRRASEEGSCHPLLRRKTASSIHHGTHFWALDVEAAAEWSTADREGTAVVPEAALLGAALAAVREVLGDGGVDLSEVEFGEPVPLNANPMPEAQLALTGAGVDTWRFHVRSRPGDDPSAPWKEHLAGTMQRSPDGSLTLDAFSGHMDDALEVPPSGGKGDLRLSQLLETGFKQLARAAGVNVYRLDRIGGLKGGRPVPDDIPLKVFAQPDEGGGGFVIADAEGATYVAVEGARLQASEGADPAASLLYETAWQEQALADDSEGAAGHWLLFADDEGVADRLAARLEEGGGRCTLVRSGSDGDRAIDPTRREDYVAVVTDWMREADGGRSVIYLWGLDAPGAEGTSDAGTAAIDQATAVLYLAQALVEAGAECRLWLVTRGAQPVGGECAGVSVTQAPIWGMGLGIAYDHPELRCACVDLGTAEDDGLRALSNEVVGTGAEDRVALRGTQRWVARLLPYTKRVRKAEDLLRDARPADGQPYGLVQLQPGVLDALAFREAERATPAEGEVEIEVAAAALNFLDVLKALRAYPGQGDERAAFGAECAGRIVSVGPGVDAFAVGDAVVALSPDPDRVSCLGRYVTVPATLVAPKPAALDTAESAALPVALLTAYHCLHEVARLEEGERVLIHSASGGVGLAAVRLAQRAGAEIFATAGTEEKRAYLRQLGVPHVLDSRSLAFANEVLARTEGRGVDVVLNSLTGEALRASLSVLAPNGRFVEIGKRDLHDDTPVGLAVFQRGLSFFAVDLAECIVEAPEHVGAMLHTVLGLVNDGAIAPLPVQSYPAPEVAVAFRRLAQAEHVGKVVVTMCPETVPLLSSEPGAIRADGTYLVTGGLGGIGLVVARWLAERGARHLCLIGRSAQSAQARAVAVIDTLREDGVTVRVESADVTERGDVARVLDVIDREMPVLRGIFHAAGVLDDGAVANLTGDQLRRVMAPKALGAWALHALSQGAALDHFVLFSSVASVVGLPGQSNYVAANTCLDALARYRLAEGRPALSIQWGPWAGIGLAAREYRGNRLEEQGIGSLSLDEGVGVLEAVLGQPAAAVAAVPFDAGEWGRRHPAAAAPFFERVRSAEATDGPGDRTEAGVLERLREAETPRQRATLLQDHVRAEVGQVLRLASDRIDLEAPFKNMGLDSLMTIELRNRLQVSLGLKLSATLVWNYPSIAAMSRYLLGQLDLDTPGVDTIPAGTVAASVASAEGNEVDVSDLAEMSEAEAQDLLDKKLALLDGEL